MKSIEEIKSIRDKMRKKIGIGEKDSGEGIRIVVGLATCGIAAGATPVFNSFKEELKNRKLQDVEVVQSGCLGMCKYEPLAEVYVPGQPKVTYVYITPEKVKNIVAQHIIGGKICAEYLIQPEA